MLWGLELAQSPKHCSSPQDSSPFRQILGGQGRGRELKELGPGLFLVDK